MSYTVDEPVQLPASDTGSITHAVSNQVVGAAQTHTYTLKRKTASGTDGTMTIVNGRLASYTKPT